MLRRSLSFGRVRSLAGSAGTHPVQASGIRYQSTRTLFGRPLVAVAFGPHPATGEIRGHARGVLAIGDIATGWIAIGALARGLVATGGLSVGLISVGGLGVGGLALGGLAVGGVAVGGAAIGVIAAGGLAVGAFALGGLAWGKYVVSATHQDPEALELFARWLPWLVG